MNEPKPSFYGKCYGCGKKEEIVACVSWATQSNQNGKKVFGSFKNFCSACEEKFGIGVNRLITAKELSDLPKETDMSKYKRCTKCRRYFPALKSFQTICLVCYGRSKDGTN